MTGQTGVHNASFDAEDLKLPRLVRSQLRRRREVPRGGQRPRNGQQRPRDGQGSVVDIEERVREALYGRSYYSGSHRRVHKELEGKHAA
jgi:hypothetical protein